MNIKWIFGAKKMMVWVVFLCVFSFSFAQGAVSDMKPLDLHGDIANTGLFAKLQGKWHIDSLIGYPEGETVNEYHLFRPKEKEEEDILLWGNFVTFSTDGRFQSDYRASCGNDCFPLTKGYFEFLDVQHIRLTVDYVEMGGDGYCEPFKRNISLPLGIFEVIEAPEGLSLRRLEIDDGAGKEMRPAMTLTLEDSKSLDSKSFFITLGGGFLLVFVMGWGMVRYFRLKRN